MIDNYDSFTWNLVHRIGEAVPALELGRDILVVRNDSLSPEDAARLDDGRGPSHLIISPGPCSPREAGVSNDLVGHFAGRIPILGVCLGHQCIAAAHGFTVRRHDLPTHGRTSPVEHDGRGLFAGIPSPLTAARYHSLIVDAEALLRGGAPRDTSSSRVPHPAARDWDISAWTDDRLPDGRTTRVVMGLRRRWPSPGFAPLDGVQFHPESFMTDHGARLIRNFLTTTGPGPASLPLQKRSITSGL